jgi:hypothetical protein
MQVSKFSRQKSWQEKTRKMLGMVRVWRARAFIAKQEPPELRSGKPERVGPECNLV